jgi:predicted DNA-binding WGR domain protein
MSEINITQNLKFFIDNVEKVVLENIDSKNNHYKFYHLSIDINKNSGKILAQWGRIGSRPQSKLYDYSEILNNSQSPVVSKTGLAMWEQMHKKLKKGYKLKTYKLFHEHSIEYAQFMDWLGDEGVELFDDDDEILI